MKMIKNTSALLILSVTASLFLHICIMSGVSRLPGSGFVGPLSETVLVANILNEEAFNSDEAISMNPPRPFHLLENSVQRDFKNREEEVARTEEIAGNEDSGNQTAHAYWNHAEAAVEDEDGVTQRGEKEHAEISGDGVENALSKPIKSGESLVRLLNVTREKFYYDIYWLGIYVGSAILEASDDNGAVKITSEVHSGPFISTFYKVDDYAESRVLNGVPIHFRIRQHEGKYRSDKETIFDSEKGKVSFINYLKGTRDEHENMNSVFWDLISGFFYLRTKSFEAGKTVYIDIFDSNKFFKAEVSVLGKERIKLPDVGEVEVVKVRPVLKSEGLFQNKGDIVIWLTDDNNRIPARIETSVPIGHVVAELKKIETEK